MSATLERLGLFVISTHLHNKFMTPESTYQLVPTGANGELEAIDFFCGSGGVSEGMARIEEVAIIAAVNHSPAAIEAHKRNNPNVMHFMEDITEVDKILPYLPKKVNIGWASTECTNHSNAKGGQSRDADSRSLPECLPIYVKHCNFDVFYVENVKEFLIWGPLRHKRNKKTGELMYDKPCKKNKFTSGPIMENDPTTKSIYYNAWVESIKALGYDYEYRMLCAADYGVHTIRTRYFGVFTKKGLKTAFPKPTHSKFPEKTGLLPWRACKERIDLTNEGESIFARSLNPKIKKNLRRKLSPKSHARYAYGIKKFFLKDFIAKNFSRPQNVSSMDDPLHNVDTRDRHFKVKLDFLVNLQPSSGNRCSDMDGPAPVVTTNAQLQPITIKALSVQFISDEQYTEKHVGSLDKPLNAVLCKGRKKLMSTKTNFITQNIQSSLNASSADEPLGAVMTEDEKVIVTLEHDKFILKKYSGAGNVGSMNEPYHTIMVKPDDAMVTLQGNFIVKKYTRADSVHGTDEPYHVITTNPKDQLATLNFDERLRSEMHAQEKREFFFTYFEPDEAELLDFLITDIKGRYLTSKELADITGFGPDTYTGRTETERKKHIGNAVPPKMSYVLINAFIEENYEDRKKAAC